MASQVLFLKPQQLGLQDRPYSLTEAYSVVKRAIETTDKWNKWKEMKLRPNPFVTKYLLYLLDAASGHHPSANNIKTVVDGIDSKDLNNIHNDFGEIIGPMFILSDTKKYFPTLHLDRNDKIYWPLRSNEPLMDFKIITKGGAEYKFSSKAGTTTNTVKPNDIVGLVDAHPKLKKKWGNTAEIAVMRTLIEKSMWVGPFHALIEYNIKSSKKIRLNVTEMKAKIALATSAPVASMKPAMKSQVINNLIEAEKQVVELSKTTLDYSSLFYDAISGSIFYINWLKTDSNMLPVFHTAGEEIAVKDKSRKKVVFRSKNSPGHAKDKLGLQM